MELDDFGLPKPQDFRENSWQGRERATPFRVSLLIFVVLISVTIATGVAYYPDLAKWLDGVRKGQKQDFARAQLIAAAQFYAREEFDQALRHVNQLLKADPNDLTARDLRATIYSRLKRYPEAIADCNFLIERDPKSASPYNNRAYFRALARIEIPEAMKDVERALAKAGDVPAYVDTRGYIHYLLGDFKSALADFDSILNNHDVVGEERQRKPEEYGEIYFHRGLVYKHTGKVALQQKDYQSARRCGFRITEEPPPLNNAAAPARDA